MLARNPRVGVGGAATRKQVSFGCAAAFILQRSRFVATLYIMRRNHRRSPMANAEGVTTNELMTLVQSWRLKPAEPVICPACKTGNLKITDQSARPYREWYVTSCPNCGFEKTVAISLGAMGG
jgi:predicted RNA-binding Zn-ribbon protein involved in translation (DUF1610 family)